MTALTYTLPTVGQPASTEDAKVVTALSQILSTVNGSLDVSNLASSLQQLLHSPGDIKASGRSAAETGWLLCDGSAVSRSGATAALFTAIGTAYGAGDGSTTFNLPDLRGRVPVGLGTDATVSPLGKNEGLAIGSRSVSHNHPMPHDHTVPAHGHTFTTGVNSGGGFGAVSSGSSFAGNNHTHSGTTDNQPAFATGGANTAQTSNSHPAHQVVNWFVKT